MMYESSTNTLTIHGPSTPLKTRTSNKCPFEPNHQKESTEVVTDFPNSNQTI